MSCNGCDKIVNDGIFRSGLQYSLNTPHPLVEGADGRTYKLTDRLIPKPFQPRGGWSVEIYIHNQKTQVSASYPEAVAESVAAFFKLNEIPFTRPDLWLNLQIQWVSRSTTKHQKVRVEDLLAIATPNY